MLFKVRFFLIFALLVLTGGSPAAANFHNQCAPGLIQCGQTSCCSPAERCSFDGFCIPLGGTYCGGGRTCGPFEQCVAGGTRCAPAGPAKCTSGLTCPPGTTCTATGECVPQDDPGPITISPTECLDGSICPSGSTCLPDGGCTRPGWFPCPDTDSQCRPGFKCSQHQGCVPIKAVDCGYGRWCKPGEICLEEGTCGKAPEPESAGDR
ncbi:scavenger receptor class F, member 2 [Ruegeria sediminis]|nr:scavenger receptor class F, member 2 [Ruegeria sediminis]